MSGQSSIRIIGGKWRSRKVSFKTKDTLRPTPDRVRETLFNWLAPHIVDSICLDLYAGSGAIGLEALSRGAEQVIAVEYDQENVAQLEENQKILQATNLRVLNKNVIDWLQSSPMVADIVFVDPPYKLHLLEPTLNLLESNGWVRAKSLIYFEQDMPLSPAALPATWSIWRQSKAGNVYYYLAQKES